MFNVPIGGKIPDMDQVFTVEQGLQLSKELAASAVRYTGEQVLMFAQESLAAKPALPGAACTLRTDLHSKDRKLIQRLSK